MEHTFVELDQLRCHESALKEIQRHPKPKYVAPVNAADSDVLTI